MTAQLEPGSVVAWSRDGHAEYGLVDGVSGDTAYCWRIDGPRSVRQSRFPKPAAHLMVLFTPAEFRQFLDGQTRAALQRLRPQEVSR